MSAPDARARVHAIWASYLGVPEDALRTRGLRVVPHAKLAGYAGAWVWQSAASGVVVSVPPEDVDTIRQRAHGLVPDAAQARPSLTALFGDRIERVVGPAYHGFAGRGEFRPRRSGHARRLARSERHLLFPLRRACSPARWDAAGIDPDAELVCASFANDRVAAAASWRPWATDAGDSCVVVHPEFARCGLGTEAVAALLAEALRRDWVALYQTLVANAPARAIAARLGFQPFATHTAVRLRPAP